MGMTAQNVQPQPDTTTSTPVTTESPIIVGWWQHSLNLLGIKVPRSLCGILLIQDPDSRPTLSTIRRAPGAPN